MPESQKVSDMARRPGRLARLKRLPERLEARLFREGREREYRELAGAGSDERRRMARDAGALADTERGGPRGPAQVFYDGESDLHLAVKSVAREDVKACRWSRAQIAEGLSVLVGQRVSVAQLDTMLADTKSHRLPAEWIPAWVIVTGSRRLLDLLCAESGLWVADAVEHDLAEMARANLQAERLGAKAEEMKKRLAEQV